MKATWFGIGLVVLLAAPTAMAQSPQFTAATGTITADGSYIVSWQESGLSGCPSSGACNYSLTATTQSGWQCVDSGNNPQGLRQRVGPSAVSAQGSFPQVTASLIRAPTSGLLLSPAVNGVVCGAGLTPCLVEIGYSAVVLTDVTFGDMIGLPGSNLEIAPPNGNPAGTCITN